MMPFLSPFITRIVVSIVDSDEHVPTRLLLSHGCETLIHLAVSVDVFVCYVPRLNIVSLLTSSCTVVVGVHHLLPVDGV